MAERLPTLYPMPKDVDQYWTCVKLAKDNLTVDEFIPRLKPLLIKKSSEATYGTDMVSRIVANITTNTGFLEKKRTDKSEIIVPSSAAMKWDGSADSFSKFVSSTINRWGNPIVGFHAGVTLVNDILSILSEESLSQQKIHSKLIKTRNSSGKYDPGDKYAGRTLSEFLKLLRFARWVTLSKGLYEITTDGKRARFSRQRKDVLRVAEAHLIKLGPDTDVFTDQQKIAMSKYYMYRQCNGKGKDRALAREVAKALYGNPDARTVMQRSKDLLNIEKSIEKERKEILTKVTQWDTDLGKLFGSIRSIEKLRQLKDLCVKDDKQGAKELYNQSGGRFSWLSVEQLRHSGSSYTLSPSIQPYKWQNEALSAWLKQNKHGTVKVVTGAGKTVLALMAIESTFRENPDLRITILVPTKVLMYQWATELVRVLAIPVKDIGLRGDGHKDSFSIGKKVQVVIVNSAIQDGFLVKDLKALPSHIPHLMIADECHRYGGSEFKKAFDCRKDWTLGLSATPTTEKGGGKDKSDEVEIIPTGKQIYNYSYNDALRGGIVPPFTVKYIGVDLTTTERYVYDNLTKKLSKIIERIREIYAPRLDAMSATSLDQKLRIIINSDKNPDSSISDYFRIVRERKDLVFGSINRKRCFLEIIDKHQNDKVIVFHERIDDLIDIVSPVDRREWERNKNFDFEKIDKSPIDGYAVSEEDVNLMIEKVFMRRSFKPVMYHSGHSRQIWNSIAMEWFRSGTANIMLSVKALIEGVDVPKASIGIIRTSSSSVRQRIQTTGRILRREKEKKDATMYVIYVRDTTDERIFGDVDWSEELGSSAIESYIWTPPSESKEINGKFTDLGGVLPSAPVPHPELPPLEVDTSNLSVGDIYPGRYAGIELHVDARGTPFRKIKNGRILVKNIEVANAAKLVFQLKRGGKLLRTPQGHLITKVKGKGLIYLGESPDIEYEPQSDKRKSIRLNKTPTFSELFGSYEDPGLQTVKRYND